MIDSVTAVAPALGLRIARWGGYEDGRIVLQAMDEGARGYPRELILLPVQLLAAVAGQAPRVQRPAGLPVFGAADLDASSCLRWPNHSKDGLYRVELPASGWPSDEGSHWLLLLLYNHAPGVPGATALPLQQRRLPYSNKTLAVELNALLAREDARTLAGGLIRRCPPSNALNLPVSGENTVTLVLGSCHYPHDVLDRMPHINNPADGPADASMLALARVLDAVHTPALLLLAGDQVYVDATAGLFDPASRDDLFGRPYALAGASPGAQAALQRTELLTQRLIDDHEISDNWQQGDNEPAAQTTAQPSRQQLGVEAFWRLQRLWPADPEPDWQQRHAWSTRPIWFEAPFQGRPIFYGDTRTEREPRSVTLLPTSRIMGQAQQAALEAWLTAHAASPGPKFVATPALLLPRRLAAQRHPAAALHCDSWEGYPASLHGLLALVCRLSCQGLVFLSGDEHLSCIARAHITDISSGQRCTLHSIHSSALYAPYPFANASEAHFAENECFEFNDPLAPDQRYRCQVQTWFAPPGDGFAVITATAQDGPLTVAFHGPSGIKPGARYTLPMPAPEL